MGLAQYRELAVDGAWEITPQLHRDARGVFNEVHRNAEFARHVGYPLTVQQVNTSSSAAGVVRGIHFATVPPGQAKYVTCPRGAVLDYVVDIRIGSPGFGTYDAVLLDDVDRRSVFIPAGLGHMFVSLEDDSTVVYLCSEPFAPGREFGANPFSESLAIELPTRGRDGAPLQHRLSDKDRAAPSLEEAAGLGLLPTYAAQQELLVSLRKES